MTLPPGLVGAAAAAPPVPPPLQSLLPGQTEEDLPDPGPTASLCFDYINNMQCTRLRMGQTCKYRHLPPTHPDVIADRVKQGKMTPQAAMAAAWARGGAHDGDDSESD